MKRYQVQIFSDGMKYMNVTVLTDYACAAMTFQLFKDGISTAGTHIFMMDSDGEIVNEYHPK